MMPIQTPTTDAGPGPEVGRSPKLGIDAIRGKYLSVTSFRRDGSGVATPVWFATEGERLLVMTDEGSGKVKRIRRNPYVTIAPCSARGRVRSEPIPAHAVLLPASEVEEKTRLIARKYRFDLLFVRPIRALQALFHPEHGHEETVILAISLVPF
jgi:PPOX class probable F420-dependent enzyme